MAAATDFFDAQNYFPGRFTGFFNDVSALTLNDIDIRFGFNTSEVRQQSYVDIFDLKG